MRGGGANTQLRAITTDQLKSGCYRRHLRYGSNITYDNRLRLSTLR
ncbi:hypothetical protein MOLA814_02033 [Betaproteobacteria bacterium MOLA814]|nr:hypothetical protein MOLA814_02033 [Betaproteobacteria bacterium MOLA814]